MTTVLTETLSTGELLRAYRDDGDLRAREALIEHELPLVHALARRYAGRGEPIEDLVQVGSIGLIKAIDRFDPDRGVELRTYAIPTILGELKRHFRDKGWAIHVPRRLKDLHLRLNQLVEELGATLGRSPTIAELALASLADEEEVVEALEIRQAYTPAVSLSGNGSLEDGVDVTESIGADDPGFGTSEDRALIGPGIRALDERGRTILRLRFYEGMTQSEIAAELGISQMHVSRLIRRSLEQVRAELGPAAEREVA
ncbi:MAG TPA: SigB/SigF/SigG family RNA polymerase sigma factor [Gaiellaceae bacterium]|nr:SigB/SigF/SigG family RNA polymerase sigma factor [Gaiellaceae bacterium]